MEFVGKIAGVSKDLKTGKHMLTLESETMSLQELDSIINEQLTCRITRYKKRRSLDANAYCWVLLDKLAENLRIPKFDLYKGYIRNIGGNSTTVCVLNEAVNDLVQGWCNNGTGWQAETTESKLDGCTNVTLYYGSSTYDTEQMSRLIDMIVQDCKAVGISTMTPEELKHLKVGWGIE